MSWKLLLARWTMRWQHGKVDVRKVKKATARLADEEGLVEGIWGVLPGNREPRMLVVGPVLRGSFALNHKGRDFCDDAP